VAPPTVPYVVMIMSGTFANFDRAYEEQGQVLGASRITVLRKITLPIILPGLFLPCYLLPFFRFPE